MNAMPEIRRDGTVLGFDVGARRIGVAFGSASTTTPVIRAVPVGAVAGNALVGNRGNLITRWQALEYVTAQNLERRALAIHRLRRSEFDRKGGGGSRLWHATD